MTDASIPLQVRPPQFENALDIRAKYANLAAAEQQRQLGAQQLQQGGMQLQLQQMELDDQKKFRQAWMDANGDMDQAFARATQMGVGPKTLMTVKQALIAQREALAKLDETTLKNTATKHDMLGGLLGPVAAEADPAKQQSLWGEATRAAVARGLLKPEEVPQYPGPDGVRTFAASFKTADQLIKEVTAAASTKRAEAASTQAQIAQDTFNLKKPQMQAESTAAQLGLAGRTAPTNQADWDTWRAGLDPDIRAKVAPMYSPAEAERVRRMGMTAQEQTMADFRGQEIAGQVAGRAETARHNKALERNASGQLRVAQGRLGVELYNAGLDANGQPLQYTDPQGNPINISPLAQQIANYKLPPVSAQGYTRNRGLMNQVLAINPKFDIGVYQQRFDTMKELAPGGKLGVQALALNTLIRHSDDLMDAIGALKNWDVTPLNAGYNRLRTLLGKSAPTNFDQLKQYVVGETVKLIRGGGGDQADVEAAKEVLNKANSTTQLMDAMKTNLGVAGGKMQALNQSVQTSIGDKNFTALDEGAAEILQKRGYDPVTLRPRAAVGNAGVARSQVTVTAPDGNPYMFPNQQEADAFKRDVGMK